MTHYYLDANRQSAGPATLDEIRALVRAGTIAADPMVCAVGDNEWKLLSVVAPVPPAPAKKGLPFAATLLGDFVAVVVKHVAAWLNPGLVNGSLRWARDIGHYAVLLSGALALILALVTAIRTNSFGVFVGGIVFVVALAVAQFAALRFLGSADALIANTPSRVSSPVFLECVGLLAVLAAVGSLIFGVVGCIQARTPVLLVPALLTGVFWTFLGAIALHPEIASVQSGEGSAAEEAIGIIAFFFKAAFKIVPVFFGLLAVLGAIVIVVGTVAPTSGIAYQLGKVVPSLPIPGGQGPGFVGAGAVLTASLLPLFAYFAFLVACLPLELWRAVLSLPGKLDALKRP